MAMSGVNQSHVQPVWAEIPSRSADIGAQAMPRAPSFIDVYDRLLFSLSLRLIGSAQDDHSPLPTQNLLADPVNSRLPSPDIQVVMAVNVRAPR